MLGVQRLHDAALLGVRHELRLAVESDSYLIRAILRCTQDGVWRGSVHPVASTEIVHWFGQVVRVIVVPEVIASERR